MSTTPPPAGPFVNNTADYWTDVQMRLKDAQGITDEDRVALAAVIKQLFDNKTSASTKPGEPT